MARNCEYIADAISAWPSQTSVQLRKPLLASANAESRSEPLPRPRRELPVKARGTRGGAARGRTPAEKCRMSSAEDGGSALALLSAAAPVFRSARTSDRLSDAFSVGPSPRRSSHATSCAPRATAGILAKGESSEIRDTTGDASSPSPRGGSNEMPSLPAAGQSVLRSTTTCGSPLWPDAIGLALSDSAAAAVACSHHDTTLVVDQLHGSGGKVSASSPSFAPTLGARLVSTRAPHGAAAGPERSVAAPPPALPTTRAVPSPPPLASPLPPRTRRPTW
mmetsp:Transcript_9319/g.28220  ORF Transcript_9319/g.28220 Transcript_9319/m.28220 type:complete len:278 (+) Transcript_9319:715-1548(+)|eukprot:scaffold117358_cov28-Tisochrysis_lutea.AAC.1